MGSFMAIVSLSFLVVMGMVVAGFVWLIVYLSRRRETASPGGPATLGGSLPESADIRLRKLAALRAQGLVNEDEYQRQRVVIISSIWGNADQVSEPSSRAF